MKNKAQLKPFSIRMDADKVTTALKLGIDIADLFRKALDRELVLWGESCPTCGGGKYAFAGNSTRTFLEGAPVVEKKKAGKKSRR